MSQDNLIILLLKIGLICGFAAIVLWVAVYHVLTNGGWRKNPIGRTLVVKSLLLAALFVPQILSLFFNLNRFDSRIAAWADVVLIGAVSPVMIWRSAVWVTLSRRGRAAAGDDAGPGSTAAVPVPGQQEDDH